jgi:hypothetical protein
VPLPSQGTPEKIASAADPMPPLRGIRPSGPTGLRLLVGDTAVDLDADRWHRVTGWRDATMVQAVAVGSEVVLSAICPDCRLPRGEVFALRRGAASAERIGPGWLAAPAEDGVWVHRYRTVDTCTLSKISLTGRTVVAEHPIDCALNPVRETELGLLVQDVAGQRILDPGSLRTIVPTQRIVAVAGRRVLTMDDDGFVLSERGTRTRIPAPTSIGEPDGMVSPDGRYVAVAFEHPAWPGPRQRLDLWLLDLTTLTWSRVPGMPLGVSLKDTVQAWAPDGRLVILGEFWEVGQRLVYWRPGQDDLTVTRLSRDVRTASMVVLR